MPLGLSSNRDGLTTRQMPAPSTGPAPDSSGPGSGVTSVALSVPAALLAVTGSPITKAGTLALSLPTRAANLVFAAPASGAAAAPDFRALVVADLPVAGVRATRAANQSINDATLTLVSFDTQDFDEGGFFAPTSTDFTVPTGLGGLYVVCGFARFASNVTGLRSMQLIVNGTSIAEDGKGSVGATSCTATTLVRLAAADVVRLQVFQNSGGALNLNGTGIPSALALWRLGP